MGNFYAPGLSGLGGIRAVGISRNAEMYLVSFTPFTVTFNQDEHPSRLQAFDELSDGCRIVCYLK